MLSPFSDFDRSFAFLDAFRREMDRVWDDFGVGTQAPPRAAGPLVNVYDAGDAFVLQADVPGSSDKDITLTLHENVLTFSVKRKLDPPPGYKAHRKERAAYELTRSVALPLAVDAERASASVENGVLTITLAKAPEAKPRQIAVKTQG